MSLSEPENFTAFIQYMNPNVMNNITKASWSARAQVEWLTWAGMNEINHAATTLADLPK